MPILCAGAARPGVRRVEVENRDVDMESCGSSSENVTFRVVCGSGDLTYTERSFYTSNFLVECGRAGCAYADFMKIDESTSRSALSAICGSCSLIYGPIYTYAALVECWLL